MGDSGRELKKGVGWGKVGDLWGDGCGSWVE